MDVPIRRIHQAALIRLAKDSGRYPECMTLLGVEKVGKHPIARGGFGEVWKGIFQGKSIALKVLHIYQKSDLEKLLMVPLFITVLKKLFTQMKPIGLRP